MMKKLWLPYFILIILSIDFWNWKKDVFILSLPIWIWHIIIILLLLAIFYAIFAKYGWEND